MNRRGNASSNDKNQGRNEKETENEQRKRKYSNMRTMPEGSDEG
jgi:hypothetical protein